MAIDFRMTNIGREPIRVPVSIRQGNMLPKPPDTLDFLTFWLTSDGIKDESQAGYLGDPKHGRLYKSESPETSAELYGRSDDPQTFHLLAPKQSLLIHASSRVAFKPGVYSVTAHAELTREFFAVEPGPSTSNKPIGTADSIPQKKVFSAGQSEGR
jgi:hypothetical protein